MNLKSLALAVAGIAVVSAGTAHAAPFAPFDVRASGMGGTGVASAKAASAALFNPAMLSSQVEGDRFQFVLGAGAQAADEDNMVDQLDNIDLTMQSFNAMIDTLDGATIPVDGFDSRLADAAAITGKLSGELAALNGDTLNAIPGAGLGFGVPGKQLGVGVFASANGQLSISPNIATADLNRLNDYVAIISDGVVDSAEIAAHPELFENSPTIDFVENVSGEFDSQSQATAVGVAIAEVGVSFSRQYTLPNEGILSVGVTPKSVEVLTYDYTSNTDSFEDADIENTERGDSGFDLDFGAVYKTGADAPWQYGVVIKNLVGGDFRTVTGRNIETGTQLRAGAARMTDRTTLAVDLDITKNNGTTGTDDTQFLAFGAEYDLKFLQLRAGYRANLASGDVSDVASVGLGLGPVDISAMASDSTVGAYLQLGFGW